ncbi:unnamed protein product [Caenorhabditis sp. 36 PRJEB53466]|nr:unnamed protein product [Caenorhabditis sp. 36 PRJEB53466]
MVGTSFRKIRGSSVRRKLSGSKSSKNKTVNSGKTKRKTKTRTNKKARESKTSSRESARQKAAMKSITAQIRERKEAKTGDEKREKKEKKSSDRKEKEGRTGEDRKEKKEKQSDRKERDWNREEKEQESEKNSDGSQEQVRKKKREKQQNEAAKKVEVRNREVDKELLKQLLEKKVRLGGATPSKEVSNPILLDRVSKKSHPVRYDSPGKEQTACFDEASSFYREKKSKAPTSAAKVTKEDNYDYVPKLEDVLKLPEESVLTADGVPVWAERMEPTEEETKDMDPAITVGKDHIEMFRDKKLTLKAIKETAILDVFQPVKELAKRDEVHFHPHLVFSNTIRSLVNSQAADPIPEKQNERQDLNSSESNSRKNRHPRFVNEKQLVAVYSRIRPIQSARDTRDEMAAKDVTNSTNATTATFEHP